MGISKPIDDVIFDFKHIIRGGIGLQLVLHKILQLLPAEPLRDPGLGDLFLNGLHTLADSRLIFPHGTQRIVGRTFLVIHRIQRRLHIIPGIAGLSLVFIQQLRKYVKAEYIFLSLSVTGLRNLLIVSAK